ncbi:MAG: hypothetical protein K8S98_09895 [Planctomycetes bacterium]|nr:hypothetical protein [Planctomycetota bacterium]
MNPTWARDSEVDPRELELDALRTLEIVPSPPPRVVGPGRRERDYLKRVARLEDLLQYERDRQKLIERELETSVQVERGAQRRLDRVEDRLDKSQQRERRLATLVGALQRDNELLRQRVLELEAASVPQLTAGPTAGPATTAPERRGFWARVFGGAEATPRVRRAARRRDA